MTTKCASSVVLIPPEFEDGVWLDEETVRGVVRQCGVGVKVYRGCRLLFPDGIVLGDYTQVDEGVRVFSGKGVWIGSHVHLAFGSSISGGGSCVIGDYAGIGAGVRVVTGTERVDRGGLTNPTVPCELRVVHRGSVIIESHAIVFTNSVVLPDVTIGEGAVVSAGSIVHHDLQPWTIYGGNPLVKIGVRPRVADA